MPSRLATSNPHHAGGPAAAVPTGKTWAIIRGITIQVRMPPASGGARIHTSVVTPAKARSAPARLLTCPHGGFRINMSLICPVHGNSNGLRFDAHLVRLISELARQAGKRRKDKSGGFAT